MKNKKKWLPGVLVLTGVLTAQITASAANIEKDQLAFAKCDNYINIRSQANTDSAIVARLHNKNAVTVLEIIDDEWCMISSGNAVGYMKYKHLVAGEEAWAIADEVSYQVAIVHPKALNVRATASKEGRIIDVVTENQQLEIVNYDGGAWVKVAVAPDSIGYIDASLCSLKTYYPVAELLSTEALAQVQMPVYEVEPDYSWNGSYGEEADYNWDGSYEEEADYNWDGSYEEADYNWDGSYEEEADYNWNGSYEEEPDYNWNESYEEETDYNWNESYEEEPTYGGGDSYEYGYEEPSYDSDSASGTGQSIVDYALQFVGNPYVYGGTSLTNGTDCSGFTQSVMSNFGINLARVAAEQAYGGQSVDLQDIQPGDLLFYSDGGGISHVGIYAGGGQIVHAATEDKGIIVSDCNYSTPVGAARYW